MHKLIFKAFRKPLRASGLLKRVAFKKKFPGYCTVCGYNTLFCREGLRNLRETFICAVCGSSSRNRHIAKVLCDLFQENGPCSISGLTALKPLLKVYEPQSYGPLHEHLGSLEGYICSEYAPGRSGCRKEDLQNLTFSDEFFDVLITQDILEHVADPDSALKEIHRVLKPGALHIFSIPYSVERRTEKRIASEGEKTIFLKKPEFHEDMGKPVPVYTNFGKGTIEYIDGFGFKTACFTSGADDEKKYGIYWSTVFASRKTN